MISNKQIEFGENLNVIEGNNETGKSTIGAFIRFIFYGLDKAGRDKYIGWGSTGCSGTLTLNSDGEDYRIERELNSGRTKDRITIVNSNGEIMRTDKAPWELFIGVPENVFVNTVFTGDLGSAVGGQGLPEAIENIVFSADEAVSTKKALKRIDDARIALYYKNQKGGKIHELGNLVSELEVRLAAAKSSAEHIFTLEDSIRTKRERINKNKERIDLISKQMQDYETYNKIYELQSHESASKQLQECKKELAGLEKKYAVDGFLPDREFSDKLRALEASAAEMKELSSKAAQRLASAEAEMKTSSSNSVLRMAANIGGIEAMRNMYKGLDKKASFYGKFALVSIILSLPFAVCAGLLIYFGYTLPYAVIAGVLFAFLLIFGIINAAKASKLKKGLLKLAAKLGAEEPGDIPDLLDSLSDKETASEEKTRLYKKALEDKQRTDETYDALDRKIREFTKKFKETGISGLPALISYTDTVVSELSNAHKQVEMAQYKERVSSEHVSGESADELRGKLTGALKEEDVASFNCDERRTEFNLLMRQNEFIVEKISSEEQNFAAANATFTLPATIYAKLLTARTELEEATDDYKAYALAYEKLSEASAALRSSISPTLAKDAGEFMAGFSDGKYDSLGISNKLEITYSGGGMTHTADTMSSGTQDIAYVSLRLALIKMLFPKKAPAFFDDTFARVDDIRARHIAETLAKLDMQSVIFTCHGREGRFAEEFGGRVIKV